MTTFTQLQNDTHRKSFIDECRQKAWGARCHADWISKRADELMAEYQKLSEEHQKAHVEIETLKTALDSHTVDNRQKRKDLQAKTENMAKQLAFISQTANDLHKAMQQLHANAEQNLSLAAHAEGWGWKDVDERTTVDQFEVV